MTNRIIKFRAWMDDGNEKMCAYDNWGTTSDFWMMVEKHDFPVMQFTGLLDKHGKEVYEGDIVKVSKSSYGGVENRVIGWWEDTMGWGYVYVTGEQYKGFTFNRQGFLKDVLEIIGNIFENPEYLK